MADNNVTTTKEDEYPPTFVPKERLEIALEASYELESLAIAFPRFAVGDDIQLPDEYLQHLLIKRIKKLACVVMSALTDDMETSELRQIVELSGGRHG